MMFCFGKSKAESKALEQRLSRALKKKVDLTFQGDGVRRILIEPHHNHLKLRLDPLFKEIDDTTFLHLVNFIEHGHENHKAGLISYLKKAHSKQPKSEKHPFQNILNQLRHNHFPNLPPLNLVWGKEGKKGQQKTIRLASYWPKRKEIRLHPYLEIEGVPDYYIEYLLYHELCHAYLVMSGQAKDGEQHGPDFMKLEKKFPLLHRAIEWEELGLAEFLEQCKRSRTT